MSGNASLQCPICLHTGAFVSAEILRQRLIKIGFDKIICPVCQEEVLGIEKLITHLLSHISIGINNNEKSELKKSILEKDDKKKPKDLSPKHNLSLSAVASAAPVTYVKIYPKLPVVLVNESKKDVKAEKLLSETNTTCQLCGLQFIDANILKMHMCLIHNIEDNSNQTLTRYQCHLCSKIFKMRGSLMVHLRVAHFGFSTENINKEKVYAETDTSGHITTKNEKFLKNDNKQWQCDICKKCFTTKYFLKKHKRLHTGETPYACTQCNKTFTFQQSYHKHLLYHNDEKPHCCNVCGRAFKELSTLHNHQRIHTGEKPFSCETCGKCFRQRVSYLVHRRIHTGVMPYKCTACEKKFRYKVSQRTHKCQAQPPGTVIRQSGNLVEKLKKKHTDHISNSKIMFAENFKHDLEFSAISQENAELVLNGAKLSLEDTETEHFDLIARAFAKNIQKTSEIPEEHKDYVKETVETNLEDLINSIPNVENNVPSPSEIFKNLCLSTDIYDEPTL